jgi:hypothetical protein
MNSDNAALGGYTLDYGPFGFMEKFGMSLALDASTSGSPSHCLLAAGWSAAHPKADGSRLASAAPTWNPWVGGGMPYCFANQPQAAAINLVGLSEAFVALLQHIARSEGLKQPELQQAIANVRDAVRLTYAAAAQHSRRHRRTATPAPTPPPLHTPHQRCTSTTRRAPYPLPMLALTTAMAAPMTWRR